MTILTFFFYSTHQIQFPVRIYVSTRSYYFKRISDSNVLASSSIKKVVYQDMHIYILFLLYILPNCSVCNTLQVFILQPPPPHHPHNQIGRLTFLIKLPTQHRLKWVEIPQIPDFFNRFSGKRNLLFFVSHTHIHEFILVSATVPNQIPVSRTHHNHPEPLVSNIVTSLFTSKYTHHLLVSPTLQIY